MATTAAVLLLRPRTVGVVAPGRRTTATVDVLIRMASGLFNSPAVTASRNLRDLKSWLPSQRVALVDSSGLMVPEWYRFFVYVSETVLGGPQGSTVPDIAIAVQSTTADAAQASAMTASISQQANANAQALAAAVQVVRGASLAGSDQIPPVQLTGDKEFR